MSVTLTYRKAPEHIGPRRSYAITVGTVPGYASIPPFVRASAEIAHEEWMRDRIGAGQRYLTGLFSDVTIGYGWQDPATEEPHTRREPGVLFSGEVSVIYAAQLPDDAVVEMLDELAARIGAALEQTRVYVTYRKHAWVLTAEGRESPRADPPGGCRCHAHGLGHAPVDPRVGYSVNGDWTPVPLCTGCAHGGCDANRPLPPPLDPRAVHAAEVQRAIEAATRTVAGFRHPRLLEALNRWAEKHPESLRRYVAANGLHLPSFLTGVASEHVRRGALDGG